MTKQNTYIARIVTMLLILVMGVGSAWAKVQTVNGKTYNVVYMSSAGAGNKSGDDAANAVSGWANAYNKLSKTGGTYEDDWNYNIIVIVGNIRINTTEANTKDIPATITNVWPWEDNSGNSSVSGSKVSNGNKLTLDGGARENRIGAPTRFKNVCFTSSGKDCRMSLFLHHAMFDVGCVMNNMSTLETTNGAMDKTTHKAPSFHMMLFSDENDFTAAGSSNNAAWTQTEPMNLTIRSGKFGRILCTRIAGTNWNTQTSKRYTVGKPDQPLMAKIEVDIDPSTNTSDFNPTGYKDDIAFLCAGTTQGTVFVDMQMDIKRGQIATIVGGSQGNAIPVCSQNGIPTSTYCGRSTVNVIGENDSDVKIFRYFGGCLGRLTSNTSGTCSAFFYGHSTLNLVHGTIEQDVFASGGGLSGLRNPNNGDQHTSDQFIPYQGGSNPAYPFLGIDYSSYNASKSIVQITSVLKGTSEVIDLADTKIVTNMSGGVVKGNVYGGSYGYSSEMVVAAAPEGAGSLWGNTEVNISGGEIQGNVYGGGAGAKSYFNLATTDADRAKFLTVATVYGNTNLTITGKPTILGNIYGGGAGLHSQAQNAKDTIDVAGTETIKTGLTANEFLNIAKVYGNTNVTINFDSDWEYTGNIYGGGALGAVVGDTNVKILDGIINGNVFGAGQGEEGHPEKAKLTGNTNVTVGE